MNLLVFGCGYSAGHFVRTRADRAHTIVTARGAEKVAALGSEGFTARRFGPDLVDERLRDDIAAADALLVSVPPGASGDSVLAAFADAIAAAPLRTIVYLSTVGVYGDYGGSWVDEATPCRPASARSRERLAAEVAWANLAARTDKVLHILRLAGIYGPGRSGFDKLSVGTARRIVKPGQVFNRIHVEDIGRAIEAALAAPEGGVWNVTDDEPAPPQEVVAYAASLMGRPAPPEVAFEHADMTPMARSFYGENKRVSNARLREGLGVELAFPTYREGLRAIWEGRDAG